MIEKLPKVSICVPVYKVERYIEKCARSLFEQTLEDIEYIFVNDCSPDRSFEVLHKIVEEYPQRKPYIKLIAHKRNLGPGVARQTAASMATGEYIYFPDSDDWVELEMMEELYNKAKSENADHIIFQMVIHTNKGEVYDRLFPFHGHDEWLRAVLRLSTAINMVRRFIKNELYKKSIDVDNLSRLVRFEDYLLAVKLHFFSKKVVFVDKIYYHVNRFNNSSITSIHTQEAPDSSIRVAKMIEDFIRREDCYETYKYEVESLKQYFANSYLSVTYWNPRRYLELSANIDRRYVKDYNPSATLREIKQRVLVYLISNNHFGLAESFTKICGYCKCLIKNIK